MFSLRNIAALVLLTFVSTVGTGCATMKVDPNHPTPEQQAKKLQELAKLADGSDKVITIARDLQDFEIQLFNSHSVPALTADKHRAIQTAFKEAFDTSVTALTVAKNVTTPESTRREAVQSIVVSISHALDQLDGLHGTPLASLITSLTAALLAINLVV